MIHRISFYIFYPFIWLFSRLPMWILYIFSDFLFFIIYFIVRYRKKVVYDNLKLAFPEKEEKEINRIRKAFFKHLVDLMVESIKSFSISEKEILKRYQYENPELVNSFAKAGRNIALVGGHQANWEWSISLPSVLDIKCFGAYTKISNPYFSKFITDSREKFGVKGYKASKLIEAMQKKVTNNEQGLYILLSDQSPELRKTFYWRNFFTTKVPFHTGAEMLAKKHNLVVINYVAKKIKRGYYKTTFELITDEPQKFENYQVTDLFYNTLEKNILDQPQYYLWTHKRFKHSKNYDKWLDVQKNKNLVKSK